MGATVMTESLPMDDLGVALPQLLLYHLQLAPESSGPLTYSFTLCPLQMILLGELELMEAGPQLATLTVTDTQVVVLQSPSALAK